MIQFQSTDIVPSMAAGRQRDDGEPSGFNNISLTSFLLFDPVKKSGFSKLFFWIIYFKS